MAALRQTVIGGEVDTVDTTDTTDSMVVDGNEAVPPDNVILIDSDGDKDDNSHGTDVIVKKSRVQDDDELDPELQEILKRVSSTKPTTPKSTFTDITVKVYLNSPKTPDHIITLPNVDTSLPIRTILEQTCLRLRIHLLNQPAVTLFSTASISSVLTGLDSVFVVSDPQTISDSPITMESTTNGMTIKVRFSATRIETANVDPTSPLLHQLQAQYHDITKVTFDGDKITDTATCESLGLEEDDMLDALANH